MKSLQIKIANKVYMYIVSDAKNSQKSHKYVVSNIYSIDLPRQIGASLGVVASPPADHKLLIDLNIYGL